MAVVLSGTMMHGEALVVLTKQARLLERTTWLCQTAQPAYIAARFVHEIAPLLHRL